MTVVMSATAQIVKRNLALVLGYQVPYLMRIHFVFDVLSAGGGKGPMHIHYTYKRAYRAKTLIRRKRSQLA